MLKGLSMSIESWAKFSLTQKPKTLEIEMKAEVLITNKYANGIKQSLQ